MVLLKTMKNHTLKTELEHIYNTLKVKLEKKLN